MIGKLRGIIDSTDGDTLIIDVGGVGYQVFASSRTISAFPPGAACELTIETNVREDHIHLYGFASAIERDWFRLLVSVQGVGNKTALLILGAYMPERISHAIVARDIAAFKAISGIGPKLAERIVVELKDKALKLPTSGVEFTARKTPAAKQPLSSADDAISALVNLGYSRSDAYAAALKALETLGEQAGLDALIRASLQEVARR
ncbi:MAG: Holliday junction branch migration protein RuvA [Alphaproteobacteria bacterium]|nr:Holliday junction branch migration protein RuvA [Alphaproteobacteria bacterium]